MTRLAQWFGRLYRVEARKRARYRAYQSETLSVKLRLVGAECSRARRRGGAA